MQTRKPNRRISIGLTDEEAEVLDALAFLSDTAGRSPSNYARQIIALHLELYGDDERVREAIQTRQRQQARKLSPAKKPTRRLYLVPDTG